MSGSEKEIPVTDESSGEGGKPSRHELLTIVRKHSNLLGQTVVDEQGSSDPEMDERFWHEMLDMYFIRGREPKGCHEDDLIFFVKLMNMHGYGFNDNVDGVSPYFVRRWAPLLERVVGENFEEVDWRQTFYLNLIAHTKFSVTVAICSIQALERHQKIADTPLTPVYKVTKTVYASPSRVDFQLDSRKDVETRPAYPDICFAIDDFDSTFDAVILTERDHCYCVLLNAHDGAAFPQDDKSDALNSSKASLKSDSMAGSTTSSKITLFSGFVSYQMVREAYDAGRSRFGSLLSIGHVPAKTEKLFMRGPGGRGEVEVAVSGIADQSMQDSGPPSPVQMAKKGFGIGIGSIVRKAASAASMAAKQAYVAASSARKLDDEMLPLKCCLMSICLPWEHLAYDLLLKESATVNI
ncbi:uncharacterized protein LOC116253138 isoform X2 [Nymphaea colorata]|nr:uncharacterized protein LOC116253138 isoform X2 [Nymphaea colorata]